jgi:hypothetical protein
MKNLQKKLEAAGIKTRSYSGRGMFGAECLAATAKRVEDVYAVIPASAIRGARTDSMGFDVVVYWPGVAFGG